MTVQNMVEEIGQPFPQYTRTQVLFDLNLAYREFCFETKILSAVDILTKEDDLIAEDDEGIVTYQLPADVYEVFAIDELLRDQYFLRDDVLYFEPTGSDYDELTVRYTRIPTPMSANSESPAFTEEFHAALVAKVLAKYYAKVDLNKGMVERNRYKEYEHAAKRYGAQMRYRNTGAYAGDSMANKTAFGTQALTEGENTVALGKTFTSISSFVAVFNTSDVEEVTASRTTSTIVVTASRAIDDFAFFAYGT